ncbi:SDR family oxidoreductase [Hoyosella subflava]|uniref:Cis-2,3-dihydrobiphenyl-2,3-diol dehydrogenase n=1 Tax=Hoyosella subflava (strain DSM 45089 / JCM 17490 / NBRC 109087 / DQS3-9A1) TaxID=443218 RepID=F6EQK0_HOYSD|nr:SDR family oxidoreductase [Hoyosella subflava]AEF41877.1 Cis-2,3-dihydrobiphenyl-2,3-diol dehydrogenase [Hoyosella subflava DQS3-9A1]
MDFDGEVAVVTGAGKGIGAAIARALSVEGAKVVIADLDGAAASEVVNDLPKGSAFAAEGDVSDGSFLRELCDRAEREFGPVSVFVANAGVIGPGGLDASEGVWDLSLDVNVRAHIRAAKILIPKWLANGGGHFVSIASAAGLLTQLGSAPYSVSKHAAVAFAEWLAVTYGDRGIGVHCVCPMGVNTDLLNDAQLGGDEGELAYKAVTTAGAVLDPADVADAVLEGIRTGTFLILPHPEVLEMYRAKSADHDRWIGGMRWYQKKLSGSPKE